MTLWLVLAGAASLATLWLVRPFLFGGRVEPNEAEHAISIYRDQRDELERDSRSGLISESERAAAEQEIERRALRAARLLDGGISVARRAPLHAALAALLTVGGSFGLYGLLGAPELSDQPLAARQEALLQRRADAGDLQSRVMLLVERTQEDPESFEDWWLLARAYAALGDHASAADAYRRAAQLSDDEPSVLSAYAEAMTLANGNKVPTAAKIIFTQARDTANDPRARYYLALAKAQAQDFAGALEDWLALRADSTEDAPWMPMVRRDIVNMARFLELDLRSLLPDASEAELARAGAPVEGPAATSGPAESIAALEQALQAEPKDWQGWIRLAQLQAEAGAEDRARAALAAAREHYAGAPFVLARIDETAQALGLAAPAQTAARRGPSDEQIAAAAEMSESDRNAMVRGMVDGLAGRLEAQPDDLEGWLMLIRSYAVLQDAEAAHEAVRKAKLAFADTPEGLREITRLADSLGVVQ